MNTLLITFGEWFAQNWIILVLIVLAIALLVPTYIRQKKEVNARNELNNTIKKGTKIITTAGVYGVVESIENTTDGKIVTIITGNAKNPTTMNIHINAIGGIDNKQTVVEEVDKEPKVQSTPVEEVTEAKEMVVEESKSTKSTPKTTAKKSTNKSTPKTAKSK